jgi:hypothetical protein
LRTGVWMSLWHEFVVSTEDRALLEWQAGLETWFDLERVQSKPAKLPHTCRGTNNASAWRIDSVRLFFEVFCQRKPEWAPRAALSFLDRPMQNGRIPRHHSEE